MNHYETPFGLFIEEIKRRAAKGRQSASEGLPNEYPDETRAVEMHKALQRSKTREIAKVPTVGDIYLALFFTFNPSDKEILEHMNLIAYTDENFPHDNITAHRKEQYEKAIQSSTSLISKVLSRDASDVVAQCAAAYFMPLLDGCRGYLERQNPLRDLRFSLEDSNNNTERGAQITNNVMSIIESNGEHQDFARTYDALKNALTYMPKLEIELKNAFANPNYKYVISGKVERCKELLSTFDACNCQVVSRIKKQERAFGNVRYTPTAPEQAAEVRRIMSGMEPTSCVPSETSPRLSDFQNNRK